MRFSVLLYGALAAPGAAFGNDAIDAFAFAEGHWRQDNAKSAFEEIWSAPRGGVMTGMARGTSGDALTVLEYIVVEEKDGALIMRFKHFRADYSTWEDDAPITLTLSQAGENDVTFTADPPSETVASMRYHLVDEDTLRVDAAQLIDGKEGGFSLVFKRID